MRIALLLDFLPPTKASLRTGRLLLPSFPGELLHTRPDLILEDTFLSFTSTRAYLCSEWNSLFQLASQLSLTHAALLNPTGSLFFGNCQFSGPAGYLNSHHSPSISLTGPTSHDRGYLAPPNTDHFLGNASCISLEHTNCCQTLRRILRVYCFVAYTLFLSQGKIINYIRT